MFQPDKPSVPPLTSLSFVQTVDAEVLMQELEQRFPFIQGTDVLSEALYDTNWSSKQEALLQELSHWDTTICSKVLGKLQEGLLPLLLTPEGQARLQVQEAAEVDTYARASGLLTSILATASAKKLALTMNSEQSLALAERMLNLHEKQQSLYQADSDDALHASAYDSLCSLTPYLHAVSLGTLKLPDGYQEHFSESVECHLQNFLQATTTEEDIDQLQPCFLAIEEIGAHACLLAPHVDSYLLLEVAERLHDFYSTSDSDPDYEEEDDDSLTGESWSDTSYDEDREISPDQADAYFTHLGQLEEREAAMIEQQSKVMKAYLSISDALQEAPCTAETIEHWQTICNEESPASPGFYQGLYGLHSVAPQRTYQYLDALVDAMGENVDGQSFYAAFTIMAETAGEQALVDVLSKRSLDDREHILEQWFAILDGIHPHCHYYHPECEASVQRIADKLQGLS